MSDTLNNEVGKKQNNRQIAVNAQYIKDMSFESPKSPLMLINNKEKPKIDVSIDIKASTVGDNIYEVVLGLNANSKIGENVVFITELQYAGVFTINGIAEQDKEPTLLIFCPSILFPFARRILADITRDGGFPPLLLDPIDFANLYIQKKGAKIN